MVFIQVKALENRKRIGVAEFKFAEIVAVFVDFYFNILLLHIIVDLKVVELSLIISKDDLDIVDLLSNISIFGFTSFVRGSSPVHLRGKPSHLDKEKAKNQARNRRRENNF